MDLRSFLSLDTDTIAALVNDRGPHVLVCPVNGTRRWFHLESRQADDPGDFLPAILDRYIQLFDLFFSHGIETLLTPVLGPDIVRRGDAYMEMVLHALRDITLGDRFRSYYEERGVRTRFYGDFEDYFAGPHPAVLQWIGEAEAGTLENSKHRLFWGLFGHDSAERIARDAIRYYQDYSHVPSREELVAAYYGEYIPPADVFIGLMPPAVFDYPLLDTGSTALYFTVAPTPYFDQRMLRRILYDFLYARPAPEMDGQMDEQAWQSLESFYAQNQGEIVGVGRRTPEGQYWLPEPVLHDGE